MKRILIILLFTTQTSLFAQNVETANIEWNVVKTTDVISGDVRYEPSRVITYRKQHIVWKNNSGDQIYFFTVTDLDGFWESITSAGQITYECSLSGNNGTIEFKKIPEGFRIRLLFAAGTNQVSFECICDSAKTLQEYR